MVFPTVGDGGVVVEFDGSHWHRNSSERDPRKALEIEQLRPGRPVVRVREDPLRLTRAGDVRAPAGRSVHHGSCSPPATAEVPSGRPTGRPGRARSLPYLRHPGRRCLPKPTRARSGDSPSGPRTDPIACGSGPEPAGSVLVVQHDRRRWPAAAQRTAGGRYLGHVGCIGGLQEGRALDREEAGAPGRRAGGVGGRLGEGLPQRAPVGGSHDRQCGRSTAARRRGRRVQGPATARCRAHNPPGPGSAASNRSKGDQTPDQWRPPSRSAWCNYAKALTDVKSFYKLTVTQPEKAALGEMLDTCPAGS